MLVVDAGREQTRRGCHPAPDGRVGRAVGLVGGDTLGDASVRCPGDWKIDRRASRPVRAVYHDVCGWFVCKHESAAADKRRSGDRGEVLPTLDRERDRVLVHGEKLAE